MTEYEKASLILLAAILESERDQAWQMASGPHSDLRRLIPDAARQALRQEAPEAAAFLDSVDLCDPLSLPKAPVE